MSFHKDTKKKDEEKDDGQLSAHETLMDIISSLQKISDVELQIPKTVDNSKQKLSDDSSETPVQVSCIFCKQIIERSNFITSLQCCGAIAHIKCFAKISADEQRIIPHQCPNCKAAFSNEQVQICQELFKIIP